MPVNPTYPGVYIEEVPSGVHTIVGVATSVAAFIDYFERGPINKAIQIFNMGDFQREFGGLDTRSEASYAIDQFFKNGGSEAWVVRVGKNTNVNPLAAASVVLKDAPEGNKVLKVTAGRRMKGVSVDDPGEWGNMLRIDVDYDTTTTIPPTKLFNFTVSEIAINNGRHVIVKSETFRNLTMENGANNALDVVNEGSKMIQLSCEDSWLLNRPAQTGTVGVDIVVGTNGLVKTYQDGNFSINYNVGQKTGSAPVAIPPLAPSQQGVTLQQLRQILESAIRKAEVNEPLFTGATVQLIGKKFRVLAGRSGVGYDPHTVLTFSESTNGTTATTLGLVGAIANVQQYSLGSTLPVGAQGSDVTGGDGDLPGATEIRGVRDPDKSGMYALEDVDLFNILCIPRAAQLEDTEMQAVYSEAITYCEDRRAFLIIDIPEAKKSLQDAREWLDNNALFRHRNAAAYFPRPNIPDPLNGYRLKSVGASGTIAGLYARTDSSRGVWKAPAGIEADLRNVPDLDYKLTDAENGQLNPLGLNCLRNFKVYGNICWGARTLMGADQQASEWKYIPVRRLTLFLEESLYRGTKWVVFEPNDEPLWSQIRLNVGSFMHSLFRQGAFQGSTPRDAYLVKCDSETTTQDDINRGIVNILVGFAPLKPAEFVIIKIQQMAGQIQT